MNINILDVIARINEDTKVISDSHLGHDAVSVYDKDRARLIGDKSNDDWVIETWNDNVSDDDNVLVVGDYAFKNIEGYSKQLKGRKILILGNHDRGVNAYKMQGWDVLDGVFIESFSGCYSKIVSDDRMLSGLVKTICNRRVLLSHYPVFNNDGHDSANPNIAPRIDLFESLFSAANCDVNIHGHTHSSPSSFANSINVSTEPLTGIPTPIGSLLS